MKTSFISYGMKKNGFTLFIAMVVTGTLLLIAAGVVALAVKQSLISRSGSESQHAFYASDTGIECAIYWDIKGIGGVSAFSPSTQSDITCNGIPTSVGGGGVGPGGKTEFTFEFDYKPDDPYCADVIVTKELQLDGVTTKTTIESRGYNTCDPSNPRRVERAIRATY